MYCQEVHLVYISNEDVYQREKFIFEYVEIFFFSNSHPMLELRAQG